MAQSLRSGVSPKACVVQEGPPRRPVGTTRVLIAVRGPAPTASGANSVASALGSLARRDPGKTVRTYHEDFQSALKIGTFYLAGNRNFLLGSDRCRTRTPNRSAACDRLRACVAAVFAFSSDSCFWRGFQSRPRRLPERPFTRRDAQSRNERVGPGRKPLKGSN